MADRDEPYHRRWLHAMQDDLTVPWTAMSIGSIFADYAPLTGGLTASVSYKALQHHTHHSRDVLDEERIACGLTFGRPGV
jgi:hypothetical protein